jgi:hypothetical protein
MMRVKNKGNNMLIGVVKSKGWDEAVASKTKCHECGKIPAEIEYKGKKYCTWYCAKKKN